MEDFKADVVTQMIPGTSQSHIAYSTASQERKPIDT